MTNNALTQRLEIIQQHYKEFAGQSSKRVCIWQIDSNERRLVEAFYRQESSEQSQFPDLFLGFAVPFHNSEQYTQALLDEFKVMLQSGAEQLKEKKVSIPFRLPSHVQDSSILFQYFQQFIDCLKHIDGQLILWLAPNVINNPIEWEDWLINSIEKGLPKRVQLLLTPLEESIPLIKLRDQHKRITMATRLDLDIEGAMRQMAAGGNPQDPGVQFRKLMVEMNLAAQKGKTAKAVQFGEKAIAIAEQQIGWEHLEVGIYLSLGTFQPKSAHDTALDYYTKAQRIAKRALDQKLPSALEIYAQANFALAAFWFKQKEYEKAISFYEDITHKTADDPFFAFQQMEAYRMAAYCYRRDRLSNKAWDAYWAALQTAELLDEQTRQYTTLPYIGEGLLELMAPTNHFNKERYIRNKLETYVGPDWEEKIKQHQITTS